MRLIDIDAFKEKFIKEHELYFNPAEARAVHCIFDALDNAPTAHDVEKVVEQIHDYFCKVIDACDEDIVPQEILEYNKTICEIIRKGGVE